MCGKRSWASGCPSNLKPRRPFGGTARGWRGASCVAIAGVTVGSVTGLKLGQDFSAVVEFKLRKDVQLPSDSVASIRGHGLLGDKYIALAAGSAEDMLPAGGRLTDTESSVDLESLLSRFAFGAVQSEKKAAPEK